MLFIASAMLLGLSAFSGERLQQPRSNASARRAGATTAAAETITLAGIVEAGSIIPLTVTTHGWVRQVFFTEGNYVRKNQILLRLYHNGRNSNEFDRHFLLAPQAGFVADKRVEMGQHVPAGGRVGMLHTVSQVKIPLLMPPPLVQRIALCAPVSVSISELPGRQFTGVIEHIVPAKTPHANRLVTVLVRNSGSPLIRPRMHALVRISTQPAPSMARR